MDSGTAPVRSASRLPTEGGSMRYAPASFLGALYALTVFGPVLAEPVKLEKGPVRAPVIGGPCEGCEQVFVGLPAELASRSRIAPAEEPGEPLIIEGVVRSADGKPVEGVVVYAYHTDAGGVYPRGTTRHGRLRGWARSGSDGRYRFDTIRPGGYPGLDTPQHIHMHVIEPGRATYYIDDILFDDDPRLTTVHRRQMLRGRGGDGLARPTRDANGVWRVQRDIVLGQGIPGYSQRGAG
jgi:protocatechuate 3,4-dioxygenase beta subunit